MKSGPTTVETTVAGLTTVPLTAERCSGWGLGVGRPRSKKQHPRGPRAEPADRSPSKKGERSVNAAGLGGARAYASGCR